MSSPEPGDGEIQALLARAVKLYAERAATRATPPAPKSAERKTYEALREANPFAAAAYARDHATAYGATPKPEAK